MKITRQIARAGIKNANGRIYSKEVFDKVIEEFVTSHKPIFGRFLPDYSTTGSVLSITDISHQVLKLNRNGDIFEAVIKVLNTPNGLKLKQAINEIQAGSPTNIVAAPCGTGEIDENGNVFNYNMISCDFIPENTSSFKNLI